jgi:hypothetical protein
VLVATTERTTAIPTLATLRNALRLDLNDPAGATARWSDADLDRAIGRAVAAYSEALPRVQSTTVTTTAGSRVLPITGLGATVAILGVEWPVPVSGTRGVAGRPPWRHDLEVGTVTVVGPGVPAGEAARIEWSTPHEVTEASGTIPEGDAAILATGAAGYACLAWSTGTADNFRYVDGEGATTVDDTAAGPEWRARAQAQLDRFDRDVKRLATSRARSTRARVR